MPMPVLLSCNVRTHIRFYFQIYFYFYYSGVDAFHLLIVGKCTLLYVTEYLLRAVNRNKV